MIKKDCYGFNRVGSCSALSEQICRDCDCGFYKPLDKYIKDMKANLEQTTNPDYIKCLEDIIKEAEVRCQK